MILNIIAAILSIAFIIIALAGGVLLIDAIAGLITSHRNRNQWKHDIYATLRDDQRFNAAVAGLLEREGEQR